MVDWLAPEFDVVQEEAKQRIKELEDALRLIADEECHPDCLSQQEDPGECDCGYDVVQKALYPHGEQTA